MATQPTIQLNRNLNYGSKGDDVKQLQIYLAGMGYTDSSGKPLKPDGIYGPQTKAAVMQFQGKNGLVQDGIVGPKTTGKINEIQNTEVKADDTANSKETYGLTAEELSQINATQLASLGAMNELLKSQQKNGYAINPNIQIDSATAQRFMEQAKTKLHPVFQEQIDNEISQANKDAQLLSTDYRNTLANQNDQFGTNLEGNRNEMAKSGGGMSSARMKMEQDMMNLENRNREVQDLSFQNQLGNIGRTAESQVGSQNISPYRLPSVVSSRVGLQGVGGNRSAADTLSGNWNRGTYDYGSIPTKQESAVSSLGTSLQETANKRLGQGRSYQDLFI